MKCKGFLDLLRDSNVNLEVNVTWDTGAEIILQGSHGNFVFEHKRA